MESILTSIKKLLGIAEDDTNFDADVIMHINTVFMTLKQLGVGPSSGFYIEDATAVWADFLDDPTEYQAVKTYIYAKVKLVFDPPQNGSHIECLRQAAAEYEWRLHFDVETKS